MALSTFPPMRPSCEKLLSEDTVTYYCGFDPTAPSLHLGNLVQLLHMRRSSWPATSPSAWLAGPPA